MKRPGRVLTAAAVVLLAALAAPGCRAPAETAFANRPGEPVDVIVEWDDVKKAVVVSKDLIYLREGKDWARWASPDGEVEFLPKGDSPFDDPPKHEMKVLKSKPSKRGTAGKSYPYGLRLTLPGGTSHELDPRIEIMK